MSPLLSYTWYTFIVYLISYLNYLFWAASDSMQVASTAAAQDELLSMNILVWQSGAQIKLNSKQK